MEEETRVIYHVDDQQTPYLMKLPKAFDRVTLLDLKNALNRSNCKFFFKSVDADFGVVKEEIVDDEAVLPSFNGRIVTWLVTSDSSVSDTQSQCAESPSQKVTNPVVQTSVKPPPGGKSEKMMTVSREASMESRRDPSQALPPNGHPKAVRHNHGFCGGSSVMSSDIDTTSFMDSGDDTSTRFSTATETTHRSTRHTRRRKRRHKVPVLSQASSFSSITDSTMSLNIITVQLNMETSNFLGISIVGQSGIGGDGGVYVGCIMKGGAVAIDGRIEPGDMILEVNGISFENMSNDEAVLALRESVKRPGPITLVVAKCWDPNPKGYFTSPRQEPVRPMDPSTWVSETTRGMWNRGGAPSMSSMTSATSSIISSLPPNEYGRHPNHHSSGSSHSSKSFSDLNLTKTADMATIVRALAQPDSGLEVRDRLWLKIKIPHSFIGGELVDWLFTRVQGFADRRDARRYACNLLKFGYIQHTVGKPSFSEQCYYIFGTNVCTDKMSSMFLDDIDSVSSVDAREREVLRPLPTPPPLWNSPYITRPTVPKFLPQPISARRFIPPPPPKHYLCDTDSDISTMSFRRYPLADDLTEEDTGTERMLKEEKVLLRSSVRRALRTATTTASVYEEKPKLWTDTHQGHMIHCARLTASSILDGTSAFWTRLPDLQKLEVEDGKDLMKQLTKRFHAVTKLEYLSIAWTEMRSLPACCLKQTLKTLILRQDDLRSLSGVDGLGILEELDASSNRIPVLPKSIGNLHCLRSLVVCGNRLKALPESIGSLSSLETLNVSSNRLTRLPDALTTLDRLRDLDVSCNHLEQLPDDFGKLTRLVDFRASGNQLTCLPESFAHLKSLVSLLVGSNRLLFVPMVLGALERLEILNLRDNHISIVECALASVRSLVLDSNRLHSICSGICLCANLEVLSIERNSIATIPSELGELKKLRSLQLSGNPLTDVTPEAIRALEERGVKVRLNHARQRRREEPAVAKRGMEEEEEGGDKMIHFSDQTITVSVEAAVSSSDEKSGQLLSGGSDLTLPAIKSDGENKSDRTSKSESDSGQNATTGRDNPEKSTPNSEKLATKL